LGSAIDLDAAGTARAGSAQTVTTGMIRDQRIDGRIAR
jgi:hypothetical protein